MPLTLKHTPASGPAVTQTLAAWGFSEVTFAFASLEPGRVSWLQRDAVIGGSLLFSLGDEIEIFDGTERLFAGCIELEPQSYIRGAERGVKWTAHDVLFKLATTSYAQQWQASTVEGGALGAQYMALLTLFRDESGTAQSIAWQVAAIIGHAASVCGFDIAFGTWSGGDATPFEQAEGTMTQLDALRAALRLAPDTAHRMDYTTTPPTIHFTRHAAATVVNLTLPSNSIEVDVQPRGDQACAGVILQYRQTHTADNETLTLVTSDVHPVGATPHTPRTLFATFEFAGRQVATQQQYCGVRAIGAETQTFWKKHIPWVKDLATGFTITAGTVTPVDEEDEHTYTKYVYEGAVPSWLSSMAAPVTVEATLNGVLEGRALVNYKLRVQVTGTRLTAGGVFSQVMSDVPAEDLPTGLAAQIYAAASVRHHEGSIVYRQDSAWLAAPRVGDVVNVPAKAAWASMKAQVQSVEVQVDTGLVSLSVGPPKHLSVQDVVEWFRRARRTTPGFNAAARSTGQLTGGPQINGAHLTPDSNAIAPPLTDSEAPWTLRSDGSIAPGTFSVRSGTTEAPIPLIGETPISGGATIPTLEIPANGILVAKFTFDLTFNGDFLSTPIILEKVQFAILSSVPADELMIKYVAFCTITAGVPSAPFYTSSALIAVLCGNAANATTMTLETP